MFNSKTLFIVGAGASKEVGLPVGMELADKISKILHFRFDYRLIEGDYKFLENLKRYFSDNDTLNEHLIVANQIKEGLFLASTIDNYIDTHRHDPRISLIGKTAIVHSILNAEMKSSLYFKRNNINDNINFRNLEKTWFVQFAKILVEHVPLSEIDELFNNISIACFNYDRCIQYFLSAAISNLYSVPIERAQKLVEKLDIFHPYGSVGRLPLAGVSDGIEFGKNTDYLNIVELGKSIKTYTEQIEDIAILEMIRQKVLSAETIVFLGFGFHAQNMSLLSPVGNSKAKRVFATAKGFSSADIAVITNQVLSTLRPIESPGSKISKSKIEINIGDMTCCDLFTEYRRSLAR